MMIRFVIDQLYAMQGKPGTISSIMDVSRLGVAGNDLGALAAMMVAGQLPPDNGENLKDDRVRAVLALSPTVYCAPNQGRIVYQNIKVPFMSISGTQDDGIVGSTKAWQRRIPFDSVSNVDHFHVVLNGGDHLVYSGHLRASRQASDVVYQDAMKNVSLVFWTAYLMDDPMANYLLETASPSLNSSVSHLEAKITPR